MLTSLENLENYLKTDNAKAHFRAYLSDPFADIQGIAIVPSASFSTVVLVEDSPDIEDVFFTWQDFVSDGFCPQTMAILDFWDFQNNEPYRVVFIEHQSAFMSIFNRYRFVCYTFY